MNTLEQLVSREGSRKGGSISLQMSIKHSTYVGQMCDQEAAAQWTFHFKRSSFFYLLALMGGTQCSAFQLIFVHSCTKHRTGLLSSGYEASFIF